EVPQDADEQRGEAQQREGPDQAGAPDARNQEARDAQRGARRNPGPQVRDDGAASLFRHDSPNPRRAVRHAETSAFHNHVEPTWSASARTADRYPARNAGSGIDMASSARNSGKNTAFAAWGISR